jgi:hypothetical protein
MYGLSLCHVISLFSAIRYDAGFSALQTSRIEPSKAFSGQDWHWEIARSISYTDYRIVTCGTSR